MPNAETVAHDRLGRLDRSICGACGDAFWECSKCGVYFCECARSSTCPTAPAETAATVSDSVEDDVALAGALLARIAADDGARHRLDDVIEAFGLSRAELEADHDHPAPSTDGTAVSAFLQCPHEIIRATCAGFCNCDCAPCAPSRRTPPPADGDSNG